MYFFHDGTQTQRLNNKYLRFFLLARLNRGRVLYSQPISPVACSQPTHNKNSQENNRETTSETFAQIEMQVPSGWTYYLIVARDNVDPVKCRCSGAPGQ
jgi:hypothetical protein